VTAADELDVVLLQDARDMHAVRSGSIALVVTSPPYFAGKEYEQSLGENGVPGSYFEYLALLRTVFAECKRVLEPGGRIAVNVANLGRRPYRSLAGDVTSILQDDLGLLLRGEVVWWKGRAAGGSCAWGTFQRPANPVLRDVTERVVIASKGRFDRALTPAARERAGLPATATITRDEFLEATTDLWEMAPESATRVGHPAPFPVELPQRLMELYTYKGDVVLDPFMGSGTTAVAAVRTRRHFLGFETDATYVALAASRVEEERERAPARLSGTKGRSEGALSDGVVSAALAAGRQAGDVARLLLEECGFADVRTNVKLPRLGLELDLIATDAAGHSWAFNISGTFASTGAGLRRSDALWKALGQAAVLHAAEPTMPLVLLTTEAPLNGAGAAALRAVTGPGRPAFDVVELLDPVGHERLRAYARGDSSPG
jgi:site-specific DNA-methyltransferase (adenine-specific)